MLLLICIGICGGNKVELIKSVIYGIIQGLCEFLPISSSAHLALAHYFMGSEGETLAFDVLLHAGTLISVFFAYRREVASVAGAFFDLFKKGSKKELCVPFSDIDRLGDICKRSVGRRLLTCLCISSLLLIPAAFLEDTVEDFSHHPEQVGMLLILNGVILLLPALTRREDGEKAVPSEGDALLIGLTQLLAVFPGISRSGSVASAGCLLGLGREDAVRYSFLLSIPAASGALLLKLPALFSALPSPDRLAVYLAGALSSALSGLLAIRLVRLASKKSGIGGFAIYCFIVGTLAVIAKFTA